VTTTSFGPPTLDGAVPPPPQPGPPLPPAIAPAAVRPSEQARRSPITHVRYVALATEDLAGTVAFYQGIWGLYPVGGDGDVVFLGAGGSPEPFVGRVRAAAERRTDLIAFGAKDRAAVDGLAAVLATDGVRIAAEPGTAGDGGGGRRVHPVVSSGGAARMLRWQSAHCRRPVVRSAGGQGDRRP